MLSRMLNSRHPSLVARNAQLRRGRRGAVKGLAPAAPTDARLCASRWRVAARGCGQWCAGPTANTLAFPEAVTTWRNRWWVRVEGGWGGLWCTRSAATLWHPPGKMHVLPKYAGCTGRQVWGSTRRP